MFQTANFLCGLLWSPFRRVHLTVASLTTRGASPGWTPPILSWMLPYDSPPFLDSLDPGGRFLGLHWPGATSGQQETQAQALRGSGPQEGSPHPPCPRCVCKPQPPAFRLDRPNSDIGLASLRFQGFMSSFPRGPTEVQWAEPLPSSP